MGFGSELQSKTAHDAILRLNDQEIRLMDTLKVKTRLEENCNSILMTPCLSYASVALCLMDPTPIGATFIAPMVLAKLFLHALVLC